MLAVVAVAGFYTVLLISVTSGGKGQTKVTTVVSNGKQRKLTPLETQVQKLVTDAKLFQREQTDVSGFRRPRVYSVRCKDVDCNVAYAVAVPGRGRILFQQLEMVRAVFGKTDVGKLSVTVTRSAPRGPAASPPSEEETAAGLTLLLTTCERDKLPTNVNWSSQKEAQAILEGHCHVGPYNRGAGGGAGGNPGPNSQGQDAP